MNKREAERYAGGSVAGGRAGAGIGKCRFDFNGDLVGDLVDISLKGFGIEIRAITDSQVKEVRSAGNYMLTVDFGGEMIMAAVKNAWNMVRFEDGAMIFRGGIAIDVISPADRIILSDVIERMRSASQ